MKASLAYLVTLLACGAFASPSPGTSEPGHLFSRGYYELMRLTMLQSKSNGHYDDAVRSKSNDDDDDDSDDEEEEEEEEEEKEKDMRLRKYHLELDERPYDGRPSYNGRPYGVG
ncbi:hypothetical protein NW762_013456 [Fusarium torreyae]|uniref:Uncharacterized protein n=1 Tax=Fusarium torreyae TaxID=1237075 RepID=A0A9W8RN78_9HYPO|nr:hypothetical protein NW762_013456 [Fusarium torreyae]